MPRAYFPARPFLAVILAAAALASFCADVHAAEPTKQGRVVVTYWEKWVGFEADAMQKVVDTFNRSQGRIFVEYFAISNVDRKTIVATAGGDPPDVAGLWTQNLGQFADAGALTPLDDFIRADGLTNETWLARYDPVYARICTHAGRVYAGISTPAALALHWNKALFREAGLDPERPPRTLAEFDEYARKLTKRDPKTGAITQMGFLPKDPGWWPWIFYAWFGGKLFDQGAITLGRDPHNVAAMKWVASYTSSNGAEAVRRFQAGFGQQASSEAPFFTGKTAMIFQGVWFNNYIRQYKPGLDYGVGPWPEASPGVRDFTMAEADILVIPRGARHPQEAWEFIKYVNSSNPKATRREELQGIELTCFLHEKNSPLREWSPFFAQHHPHPHIEVFRKLGASPNAVSIPQVGVWREYDRELVAVFEQVWLLAETPEKALARADARIANSWELYKRSLRRHGQSAAITAGDPVPAPSSPPPASAP